MDRSASRPGRYPVALLLAGALALAGCGESSSTSSSDEKATVKGVVKFDGKPVTKGTVTFDPSNINRKMASATSAPIGADGTYSVTTLVGRNLVSFELPGLASMQNKVNNTRLPVELKAGENTFDAELPQK